MLNTLRPLIFDPTSGHLSIGRISYWPVLVFTLIHWTHFTSAHLALVTALLTYNTVSKYKASFEETTP